MNKIPIHIMLHVWELYEDNDPFLGTPSLPPFLDHFRISLSKSYGLDYQIIQKNRQNEDEQKNSSLAASYLIVLLLRE